MRIIKLDKSSVPGSEQKEQVGDLLFSIEEIDLDQKDGSLDWMKGKDSTGTIVSEAQVLKTDADSLKQEYNRLLSKGIRLLSMREHSVYEITTKLSVKCEQLGLVLAVVDSLLETNYLSDQRFTESFVRSRQNRGFGPFKIKTDLSSKGIDNNMIDDYLNVNSSIWFEVSQNQYRKKYGAEPVKDYNTWAKRARFMQSRGFSTEHIQISLPPVERD